MITRSKPLLANHVATRYLVGPAAYGLRLSPGHIQLRKALNVFGFITQPKEEEPAKR